MNLKFYFCCDSRKIYKFAKKKNCRVKEAFVESGVSVAVLHGINIVLIFGESEFDFHK